jgi:hypothetical protein
MSLVNDSNSGTTLMIKSSRRGDPEARTSIS